MREELVVDDCVIEALHDEKTGRLLDTLKGGDDYISVVVIEVVLLYEHPVPG